MKDNFMLFKIE